MAKLITDHDPYHIHKLLGLFGLLHFLVRTILLLTRGYAFCSVIRHQQVEDSSEEEPQCSAKQIQIDVICTLLQGCLSWTSLLLPLPKKRNFSSPMIWPEFRWHSIFFATRHVIGVLVSILNWWPTNNLANYAAKMALVMGTSYAADWATRNYGCHEKRTTNAMPYPSDVTPEMQRGIKLNYSLAQFLATFASIAQVPDLSFWPLMSIQIAAFLMTLCRKNIITALTVHQSYIAFLCFPIFLPMVGEMIKGPNADTQYICIMVLIKTLHLLVCYMRITCGYSKWATWGTTVFILCAVSRTPMIWNFIVGLEPTKHPLGMAFMFVDTYLGFKPVWHRYAPIFTGIGARGYDNAWWWWTNNKSTVKDL